MTVLHHRSRPGQRLYVKSIGSFVPKLAQKAFEKYGFSTVTLLTDWSVIVGPEFSRFTRPERLKWPRKVAVYGETDGASRGRPGATLVLRVDPARALEIQYGSDQLIERINCFFGYNAVAAIRVLQAPVDDVTKPARAPAKAETPNGGAGVQSGVKRLVNRSSEERLSEAIKRLQATF